MPYKHNHSDSNGKRLASATRQCLVTRAPEIGNRSHFKITCDKEAHSQFKNASKMVSVYDGDIMSPMRNEANTVCMASSLEMSCHRHSWVRAFDAICEFALIIAGIR